MTSVLVVDDDPDVRDLVTEILETWQYDVQTAASGADALHQIREHPPSVILLDLMMPVMNGWEFLRECRRQPPCAPLPIIVMSAAAEARSAVDELGAQALLTKPFEVLDVVTLVDKLAASGPG